MNNNAATQQNRVPIDGKGARGDGFSDSLPRHSAASVCAAKFCPRVFACCAWIGVAVFGVVLAVLILGVVFVSFLQSGLPDIRLRMLDLSKFEIKNSTNPNNALLNSKVVMSIEMKNKNDKMELSYSDIAVHLVSEDVTLGNKVIAGFSHDPGNTTFLNVTLNVAGGLTDRDNALQIEDDRKRVQMDVQVTMKSTVSFHLGIFNLNKVPIRVACEFHQYLLLYRVKEPICNIRMFPTR